MNENDDFESHDDELNPNDSLDNISSSLKSAPKVGIIPFSLVKRHDKKTVQLLINSTNSIKTISGKRVWHNYEFKEDLFLEKIFIKIEDYSESSSFEIYYVDYNGKRFERTQTPSSNTISFKINTIVREFGFRPPRRIWYNPKLHSILLYGFQLSEASQYGEFADSLEYQREKLGKELDDREAALHQRKIAIELLEASKNAIEGDVAALRNAKIEVSGELAQLRAQRTETTARIETQEQSVRQNIQKLDDAKSEIGRASEVRSKLARSIIEKESNLKSLKANINLFPSELSDFVSQGSRDVRLYFVLALIPILIIASMFAILVEGGVDLTTRITGEESVNILAILVSRMPFVVVAATIITACYYLARMFILEMVRVNRQKLSLSKIGIIAKDISHSTEHDLNLSDEEKQERRLRFKMDMLRDHLKDYLSKDFEPSLPKRSPLEQMRLPGFSVPPMFADPNDETPDNGHDELDTKDEDAGNDRQ
jgi:hypothetical protein